MSEPAKKHDQSPESHTPKAKPEILKMAESAAAQPIAPPQAAQAPANPLPEIITKRFLLAGFEAPIDLEDAHWPGMDYAKAALKENLHKLGNAVQPQRFFDVWEANPKANYKRKKHHSRRMFFFGVEVMSLEDVPEGFVTKDFPETTYALFREREHGSPKFNWLAEAGYKFDGEYAEKYAMDLEIFDHLEDEGPEWDALIPIERPPEGYTPKTKPEILRLAENSIGQPILASTKPAPSTIKPKARNTVRVIELPRCRMVTSGPADGEPEGNFKRFSDWFSAYDKTRADPFYARDFMWASADGMFEWGFALAEEAAGVDTGGFDVIDFPGGLYAVAVSVDADGKDHDRVYKSIQDWVRNSGCFALDENETRRSLGNITSPPCMKERMGYHQMDLYFPIRIKEENEA